MSLRTKLKNLGESFKGSALLPLQSKSSSESHEKVTSNDTNHGTNRMVKIFVGKFKKRSEQHALQAEYYVDPKFLVECEDCNNIRKTLGVKNVYCSQKCETRALGPMSERKLKNIESRMLITNSEYRSIHSKVRWNYLAQVEVLIESGCPIELVDEHGNSLLLVATQQGHFQIVQYLLSKKADVNCINNKGNTPLHYAFAYKYPEIIELLLK